ncbi:MAG: hypothetical protein ABIF71_00470 [Planctomycetota bacterium]
MSADLEFGGAPDAGPYDRNTVYGWDGRVGVRLIPECVVALRYTNSQSHDVPALHNEVSGGVTLSFNARNETMIELAYLQGLNDVTADTTLMLTAIYKF